MGTRSGEMVQANTGLTESVYEGWSWPCFFFGSLWYLAKGMWGIGLLWLCLSIVTGSVLHWLGILYMSSIANRQYLEHLGSRGFVFTPISTQEIAERSLHAEERRTGYLMLGGIVVVLFFGVPWLLAKFS